MDTREIEKISAKIIYKSKMLRKAQSQFEKARRGRFLKILGMETERVDLLRQKRLLVQRLKVQIKNLVNELVTETENN